MIQPGVRMILCALLVLVLQATPSLSFQQQQQQRFSILPTASTTTTTTTTTAATASRRRSVRLLASASNNGNNNKPRSNYVPIREDLQVGKKKALIPKIGDIVRYYDLDGGDANGQVLVGKISYVFGSKAYGGYSVELNELEDVGDGYFAEYSSALISRGRRKTERRLEEVSPIAASFVGVEQAYKVPLDGTTNNLPKPRQETYDLDAYEGPSAYATFDADVVEKDAEKYEALKFKLFRNVLLTGLVGTILTNATKGSELAIIYLAGSISSLLYLFLLSVKTDTVAVNAEDNTKNLAGKSIANLRFGAPVVVLVGVSIYNGLRGFGGNSEFTMRFLDTVTREQFGAVVLGFLTYRIPLFVGQLRDAFKELEAENAAENESSLVDGGVQLPGSAGVAAKLLSRKSETTTSAAAVPSSDTVTILLVSGPQATGRPELVRRLLESDDYNLRNLVAPKLVVRNDDGATYERLERRNEFLSVDATNSVGLTKDGILEAASGLVEESGISIPNKNVVVIDADVSLTQKLTVTNFGATDTRLIGVWVGLSGVKDFEARLSEEIADGTLKVPEDETQDSYTRGKIKDIINEIDFGLGSGIFEFTILNDSTDPDKSLRELKEAAAYAFK